MYPPLNHLLPIEVLEGLQASGRILVVAIVGFLVLSPGEMPGTQTVRGGVIPGTQI